MMKKNYLAPKSETLMAILAEICTPIGNPSILDPLSGGLQS